ncbi:MAG: hypothetical protein AAF251_08280 [Pseudomonadota bacterium]
MPSVNLYQQVADAISPELRHLTETEQPSEAEASPMETEGASEPSIPAMPFTLKRTGQRPYEFKGRLLAMLSGISSHLPFWYEINIYQTDDMLLCELKLFHKDADAADLFRVTEHFDMESVFNYLEGYDPSDDLDPCSEVADHSASSATLALNAARLQLRVNQLKRHYESVVGEILQALQRQFG